jgi:hypothetical protein
MQCSVHNQCSDLFICIMNYLHILCIFFMVSSCVLCMTLIVFICMYFGLFICTNLVDVISLFFMIFSFHLLNFGKNQLVSNKNRPELATPVFKKPTDLSVKPTTFIGKTGCISVLIFTVPQLSPVHFCPRGSDFSCRIFDTAEEYSDGQRILFVQVGLVPSRLDMGG